MTAWVVILWRFAASYVRAKHNRAVDAEFQHSPCSEGLFADSNNYTVSQSVFVVYLTRFFSDGREDVANRSAISGYSCVAIMTCEQPSNIAIHA